MEFFRIRHDIPFMRHALVFNVISLITFILAVVFLVTRGLFFSIEFTGGTVMVMTYPQAAELQKIRDTVEKLGYTDAQVQNFGSSRDVMLRMRVDPKVDGSAQSQAVFGAMTAEAASGEPAQCVELHTLDRKLLATPEAQRDASDVKRRDELRKSLASPADPNASQCVELKSVEYVGPSVGKELATDGALALLVVSIGIVLYLWLRFEWKFGLAAIIANLHDVVIILGFFAFFQWEFSLSVLAAVLAVLGYSVNESVVVFDRIRENFRKMRKAGVVEVINNAITRTMSRTIITHGCTQLMVCSMLLFGGETLHYFALALTIGICFGIYSSVLVASPLVMWFGVTREDLVKGTPKRGRDEGVV
jgi:preprotein translocase subunit SecF